jgi:myo-inositol-1(or 4)-monophosphatase
MINLNIALKFSQNLALQVGKILLDGQKNVQIKIYKDRQDIATNIDFQAEKLIIKTIEKEYPKHNIISEEKGEIDKKSDYTWYVDPLDGTKEYLRQIPAYNTSFCLFFKKEPILGVVNIPYAGQLFSAAKSLGAFLNLKKIAVNKKSNLRDSIIYCHPPCYGKINNQTFEQNYQKLYHLTKKVYRLRYAPDANGHLCYLALGSIEAYLNFVYPIKEIGDVVPGLFIAKMAGAKITDLKGKNILDYSKPKQFYIASNGKVHKQLIKILKS